MGYDKRYDLSIIRNSDDVPVYKISDFITRFTTGKGLALDIGCGTCRKIFSLASYFTRYYAIDNSDLMIDKALINIKQKKINNIEPFISNAFYLPFNNSSLDFVSCMLAPFSISEIHRVLNTNGILFMEMLGADDKKELKIEFGKDKFGDRGILLNTNSAEREKYFYTTLSNYFENIIIKNFKWDTSITKEGLKTLLELTPTIRGFNLKKDNLIIEEMFKNNNGSDSITFKEHRMIITAKKKNSLKLNKRYFLRFFASHI